MFTLPPAGFVHAQLGHRPLPRYGVQRGEFISIGGLCFDTDHLRLTLCVGHMSQFDCTKGPGQKSIPTASNESVLAAVKVGLKLHDGRINTAPAGNGT